MVQIKIIDIAVSQGYFISNHIKNRKFVSEKVQGNIAVEEAADRGGKRIINRYNWQNTIMLSLDAIQELFYKTNLSGADMDMIVLSSQLPEYVAPATSVKIHNVIGGKKECICYDVNSNGCGMTLAFDQISKYMSASPHIKRALLVGCDYMNVEKNNLGDAACAVILEKTEEACGVYDAVSLIRTEDNDSYQFPYCGFSNLFMVREGSKFRFSITRKNSDVTGNVEESIATILNRNSLTMDEIGMYCFSQGNKEGLDFIRERLKLEKARSPYIGDIYGDTGTSAPFIALYEAWEKHLIKRGDYFLICAFGNGAQNITMLCKF
ncbi:3-oxoacyl-[acyl-carrier-protein] synthase III C-terminal domain-containing protein [Anaerocolumna xylanovorans]|uniref:3-oxoacyl-[acyl-carrier-protein] synthase-3 n=1 Tax=Anaerocolumna xylanovorans DSM 12503 TaxID=1121345 RepID=A0A1M7YB60_9FIRM|nr:3-oxoacyl-[acyl-carrier-protein] synthase III C-terminal domain-containing protein [Anaerocolumna xylanovorans]SHO49829.1 3-oxoacyl-[acyl-carrier-protein] synthase-3 [Anaerocolumna xylanovorans DSM 12503]